MRLAVTGDFDSGDNSVAAFFGVIGEAFDDTL